MNFYTHQHKHYCGIDLPARAMYVGILDQHGTKLVHKNLSTTPEAFLRVDLSGLKCKGPVGMMFLLIDPIFLLRAADTNIAVPLGSPCGSLSLPTAGRETGSPRSA